MSLKRILLIIGGIFCMGNSPAWAGNDSSDPFRPDWLADKCPKPSNSSFYYQITSFQSSQLNEAREGCFSQLLDYFKEQNKNIRVSGTITKKSTSQTTSKGISETIDAEYAYNYSIEGESFQILFEKTDEYWEQTDAPGGRKVYHCHTLFAVANSLSGAYFDQITFSRKYGARGLLRSMIVPGWGQIYKGSSSKGLWILGGEMAFAGGIIACESMNQSYRKKINETHDVHQIQAYADKADTYENVRNACIGAAAALYVYNLIDAVTANGRKRSIINENRLALIPVVSPELNGLTFAFRF